MSLNRRIKAALFAVFVTCLWMAGPAPVKAAGTTDSAAVIKIMKDTPINDMFARQGRIREDGRMVHDMYFVQVKTPEESNGPWDYYENPVDHSGRSSFSSLDEGGCPLVKQR